MNPNDDYMRRTVRDLVDHDKALCFMALARNPDVVLRAAELMRSRPSGSAPAEAPDR